MCSSSTPSVSGGPAPKAISRTLLLAVTAEERRFLRGGGVMASSDTATSIASAVAERAQAILVDAEVMADLVHDGDAHLARELGRIAPEVAFERLAEDGDRGW